MKRVTVLIALLLVLALVVAIVPCHHDISRSYITTSDADIVYVYEVLRLNDALPQWHFDHPGYIFYLLLSVWFRLLRLLGVLTTIGYSEMVALPAAAMDGAYARLVMAGRLFSVLLAWLFVVMLLFGARRLTNHAGISAGAAILFATGVGISHQSLILRTELPSAFFAFLAFLMLMESRQGQEGRSELFLGLSGFLALLALASKVQAIFVLLGFPVLALAFGHHLSGGESFVRASDRVAFTLILLLTALAVGIPTIMMIVQSIRFRGMSGGYQALTAIYIALSMILYSLWFRVPARRMVNAAASLLIGISLGLLANFLRHDTGNTTAIINYVDHMLVFSTVAQVQATDDLMASITASVVAGLRRTIDIRFSWSSLMSAPIHIVEWFAGIGALALWLRGKRRAAIAAQLLLGLSLGVESAFNLRGFPYHYWIYTDPWTILAGAIVLCAVLNDLSRPLRATGLVAASLVAAIVSSLSWKHTLDDRFVPRQPAENACTQSAAFASPLAAHFGRYCQPPGL